MVIKRLEYGLLLLAAMVLHIFLVDYLSFLVLAFVLVLPAVSLLVTFIASRGTTVGLEIKNPSIHKNEVLPMHFKVKNPLFFMPCRIRMKLVIRNEFIQEEQREMLFMTVGRTGQTVKQTLSSKYCGKLDCSIRELRVYDCLGLFSFRLETDSQKSHVVFVLPSVYPLMGIDSKTHQDVENNESLQIKAGDDPSEIFDIREYREGDRLAKIHWKLSSKLDQMMVRDFGLLVSNDVLLLFDLNGGNKELDGLLDTINSISYFLLENQIIYEMAWYNSLNRQLVHSGIIRKDDLDMVLNAVLAAGRAEQQPLALMNCSGVNGLRRYSDVIYLCSAISPDSVTLLCEWMPESRVRILLVAEHAVVKDMDVSLTSDLGADMKVVDLENIRQNLSELIL